MVCTFCVPAEIFLPIFTCFCHLLREFCDNDNWGFVCFSLVLSILLPVFEVLLLGVYMCRIASFMTVGMSFISGSASCLAVCFVWYCSDSTFLVFCVCMVYLFHSFAFNLCSNYF